MSTNNINSNHYEKLYNEASKERITRDLLKENSKLFSFDKPDSPLRQSQEKFMKLKKEILNSYEKNKPISARPLVNKFNKSKSLLIDLKKEHKIKFKNNISIMSDDVNNSKISIFKNNIKKDIQNEVLKFQEFISKENEKEEKEENQEEKENNKNDLKEKELEFESNEYINLEPLEEDKPKTVFKSQALLNILKNRSQSSTDILRGTDNL
jgi:hypothetical protein